MSADSIHGQDPVRPSIKSLFPRILVISDDLDWRALIANALRNIGLPIVLESDGFVGVRETIQEKGITVVVLTQNMAAMNGSALCRILRQDARCQHVAIVLLVDPNNPESLDTLSETSGADRVVPISDDLVHTIFDHVDAVCKLVAARS